MPTAASVGEPVAREAALLEALIGHYLQLALLLEQEQALLLDFSIEKLQQNTAAKERALAALDSLQRELAVLQRAEHPSLDQLRRQAQSAVLAAQKQSQVNQRLAASANSIVRQSLAVITKGFSGACLYGNNGAMECAVKVPSSVRREV